MKKFSNEVVSAAIVGLVAFGATVGHAAAQETVDSAEAEVRPIAVLGAKLGYNSARGGIAGVSLTANEFMGRQQTLSFSGEVSRDDRRFNIFYGLPYLTEDLPSVSFGAFRNDTRAGDTFKFDTLSYGASATWTRSMSETSTLAASLMVSSDRLYNLGSPVSVLISADAGSRKKAGFGLDYAYSTDQFKVSLSSALSGSDTGARSVVNEAKFAGVLTKDDAPISIMTKFAFGQVASRSGTSHIGDRFMMGQSLVRGFDYGGIGPRDLAAGNAALGGNTYASLKLDVAFPNLVPNNERVLFGLFADAGSLWALDSTAGGLAGADIVDDSRHIRSSVGVSMRYQLGAGTANLYLSRPIRKENYDRTSEIQFSFETKF